MIADRVYVSCRTCGHRDEHDWQVEDVDELTRRLAWRYKGVFRCPACGAADEKAHVALRVPAPAIN